MNNSPLSTSTRSAWPGLLLALALGGCGGGASPGPSPTPAPIHAVAQVVLSDSRPAVLTSSDGTFEIVTPPQSFDEVINQFGAAQVTVKTVTTADITADERTALATLPPSTAVAMLAQMDIQGTARPTTQGFHIMHPVGPTNFKVRARNDARCQAGATVTLQQVIGNQMTARDSDMTADGQTPQTITGNVFTITYLSHHFLMAFACPKAQ